MAGKEKLSLGAAAAWVPLAVNESLLGSSAKHSPGYEMVGGELQPNLLTYKRREVWVTHKLGALSFLARIWTLEG